MWEGTQELNMSLGTSIRTWAYTSWHSATYLLKCYRVQLVVVRVSLASFWFSLEHFLTYWPKVLDKKPFVQLITLLRKVSAKWEQQREQGDTFFYVLYRVFERRMLWRSQKKEFCSLYPLCFSYPHPTNLYQKAKCWSFHREMCIDPLLFLSPFHLEILTIT